MAVAIVMRFNSSCLSNGSISGKTKSVKTVGLFV